MTQKRKKRSKIRVIFKLARRKVTSKIASDNYEAKNSKSYLRCKINGVSWEAASFFNTYFVSNSKDRKLKTLDIRGTGKDDVNLTLTVYDDIIEKKKGIDLKSYTYNRNDIENEASRSETSCLLVEKNKNTSYLHIGGSVKIVDYNFNKISGTFNADFVDVISEETVHITEGVFQNLEVVEI